MWLSDKANHDNYAINYCMYAELGKLLNESNILHITSYFYQEVIYYSYILLHQKSNFVILLYYFIAFKSNNIM